MASPRRKPCSPQVKNWALTGPADLLKCIVGWRRVHSAVLRPVIEKHFPELSRHDVQAAAEWVAANSSEVIAAFYYRTQDLEARCREYEQKHRSLILRLERRMDDLGL